MIRQRLDGSILPALGHLRLEQVDRGTIQRAVTAWASQSAATTTRQSYKYTSAIFRHAVVVSHTPRTSERASRRVTSTRPGTHEVASVSMTSTPERDHSMRARTGRGGCSRR